VIARLQAAGLQSLDLLTPAFRDRADRADPLDGLCNPLSQALFCLYPRQFTAWVVEWDDDTSHVFLRDRDGAVLDLVSYPELLCEDEDYDAGEPVRWQYSRPDTRTRALLARAGLTLPLPTRRR
jgi:hypothetical protein